MKLTTAIRVDALGKRYRIGRRHAQQNTLRDVLAHAARAGSATARNLWRRGTPAWPDKEWFWALQDVDFEVQPGQAVGIVGANGAGKSTLLKVLSRITEPTMGSVAIRGRVGSLIEVGAGFHSELTGRENTYLNGAVLGMRRSEIDRKFDEIVAFAGIDPFIDTPIKRYSSGMQLRLGFAVAAHLETEILIVDEVLAVGDAAFQKKCLSTMSSVANQGRTVLFVSHNAAAVKALCDRAIWLREGRVAADASAATVLADYLMSGAASGQERLWEGGEEASPGSSVVLRRVAVRPEAGLPTDRLTTNRPFVIEVDYWTADPLRTSCASITLFNEQDVLLFDTREPDMQDSTVAPAGKLRRAICRVPSPLLPAGAYRVEVALLHEYRHAIAEPEALYFTLFDGEDQEAGSYRRRAGVMEPPLYWQSTALASSKPASSTGPAGQVQPPSLTDEGPP